MARYSFPPMIRSSVVSDDGASGTGNTGDVGGVESTEVVLASDYPVFGTGWRHFDENRLPNFRERPFRPLIGYLMPFGCPEMTTFSNDTGQDIFKNGLEVVRESWAGKTAGYFVSGDGPIFRRKC
jgi:hypothetical protein